MRVSLFFVSLLLLQSSPAFSIEDVMECAGWDKKLAVAFKVVSGMAAQTDFLIGRSEYVGMSTTKFTYPKEGPPKFEMIPSDNERVQVQQNADDTYTIHYDILRTSKITFKSVRAKGVISDAKCRLRGSWQGFKVQSPRAANDLLSAEMDTEKLTTALSIAEGSDLSTDEKLRLVNHSIDELDRKNTWKRVPAKLIHAMMNVALDNGADDSVRLALIDRLRNPSRMGRAGMSIALKSLADCKTCVITDEMMNSFSRHIGVEVLLPGADPELGETLRAVASIVFQKRHEKLKSRAFAARIIFTDRALQKMGENSLGSLAKLLTIEIPSDEVCSDAGAYLSMIVQHPGFGSMDSLDLIEGLIKNRSQRYVLKATLPESVQILALEKVLASTMTPVRGRGIATRHKAWIEKDVKVRSAGTGAAALAMLKESPAEFVTLGVVLQWLIEQDTPVAEAGEIISTALIHLASVKPAELEFVYEGKARGIANDLFRYSLTEPLKDTPEKIRISRAILSEARVSPRFLRRFLLDSRSLPPENSPELITMAVRHPRFHDGNSEDAPVRVLMALLTSSFLEESKQKKAKLDTNLLRSLLIEAVESKRMDPATIKAARQIILRTGSI